MYQWYHEVDKNWLEARKVVITATEIVSMIPKVFSRGKYKSEKAVESMVKGESIIPAFAALWESKHSEDPIETGSSGPMARGHIMEPYAIKEFNHHYSPLKLYHYDDIILAECKDSPLCGFSPDALTIEPKFPYKQKGGFSMDILLQDKSVVLGEIKCHNAAKHGELYATPKDKQPERLQLAASFACIYYANNKHNLNCEINGGWLIHYNPSAHHTMFSNFYTIDDLADEMRQCLEIIRLWECTDHYMKMCVTNKTSPDFIMCTDSKEYTEKQIYEENWDGDL